MKFIALVAASAALLMVQVSAASARVQIAEPEFPNFLSPPGLPGTCYWWNSAWFWACPVPDADPAAASNAGSAAAAPAPAVKKDKKAK